MAGRPFGWPGGIFATRGIFATLWDREHMNVMLDESGIRTAVQAWPGACREFWCKGLAAAQVDLTRANHELIRELLSDASQRRSLYR